MLNLSADICQIAFIFGISVPFRVFFDSIDIDPEFMPSGRARGQNLGQFCKAF